jgi:hypothetical protein
LQKNIVQTRYELLPIGVIKYLYFRYLQFEAH